METNKNMYQNEDNLKTDISIVKDKSHDHFKDTLSSSRQEEHIRSKNGTMQMDNSFASNQQYVELNLKKKSDQQTLEKEFSFERFTQGDIKNISITVLGTESKLFKYKIISFYFIDYHEYTYKIEVKSPYFPDLHCFRRYNEFQALYKVFNIFNSGIRRQKINNYKYDLQQNSIFYIKKLKLKYQNIQLPSFPSKYTIVNRTEKRRVAFHRILNGILEIAQQHHGQIQKNILQLLYVFLTKDLSGKQSNKVELGTNTTNITQQSDSFDEADCSMANILTLDQYGDEFKGLSYELDREEQQENEDIISQIPDKSKKSSPEYNIRIEKSNSIDNSMPIRDRSAASQYSNQSKRTSLPPEDIQSMPIRKASNQQQITQRKYSNNQENLLGNSSNQETKNYDRSSQPVIIQNIMQLNDKEEKDFCGYIKLGWWALILLNFLNKILEAIFQIYINFNLNFNPLYNINRKVSLSSDSKKVLYGRIVQNTLQLFSQIFDNHFTCLISIFEARIQYHPQNSRIIEIFHEYDSKKIQITLENDDVDEYYLQKNDPVQDINKYLEDLLKSSNKKQILIEEDQNGNQLSDKYIPPPMLQKWLAQLKFAISKRIDMNFNDFVFEPIGKIYLSVHEILNYKNILPNSTVFVRIKSSPFTFQTKENISDSPKWKQDFIFPFSNSFGLITLEVVQVNNKGWIKENFIEKILATIDIQIADILGHNQDTTFRKMCLPLENTEYRQKYLVKQGVKQQKEQDMQIILSLRNLSKFESIFAESSYNIYDGVKMSEQKKSIFRYYKINFTRYKRISGSVLLFMWSLNDIFYQKYPSFSKLMMVIILSYIWFANLNNILLHLLAVLLFIIIINNPKIYPYYVLFTNKYLFAKKHPFYHEPQVNTKKMNDYIKMSQCLSKIKKLNNDIVVEEQIQFTLSQTYQQLKKSFYLIHEWISVVVNYCEKFKNLLTWRDQNRTHQFFIFLIFLYVFFNHVPLRMMLFFGCIYNYIIGWHVYQKRYLINVQQGKNLIIYIYKKHWAEYRSWEQIQNQKYPNEQIKKMLIEDGLVHFYLWITDEILQEFDTPHKLMNAIATVPKKLFMNKVEGPHQSTDIYKELQQNSKLRLSKYLTTVKIWKNFLYNIPSDCYRILHPKMI